MRIVYLMRSLSDPEQIYVGVTSDIDRRLAEHNTGRSPHTAKHAPWELLVAVHFADTHKANAFERYLKTGSGRAFAKKHF